MEAVLFSFIDLRLLNPMHLSVLPNFQVGRLVDNIENILLYHITICVLCKCIVSTYIGHQLWLIKNNI